MAPAFDFVCLSHLRWDFVYQRPQHLLSRAARDHHVFFFEEPVWGEGPARLSLRSTPEGVQIVVPYLPHGLALQDADAAQRRLIDELFVEQSIKRPALWYYSPMPLAFTRHLDACVTIYDCMDELSAFRGAPPEMVEREADLLQRADLVFTGGQSLYEAKKGRHPHVYAFPSSVDRAHFGQAQAVLPAPPDQAGIAQPRIGFFGVIDERLDIDLLARVAEARPQWQLVMVGPVVKIDPAELPSQPNIHYLGPKSYTELPAYLAGWDVAMLPFARNESTRFISPTKTPEYLAAGRPTVSTSIRDVVRPYGEQGIVRIADTCAEFVAAIEAALGDDRADLLRRAEPLLSGMSWDSTWARMHALILDAADARRGAPEHITASATQPTGVLISGASARLGAS